MSKVLVTGATGLLGQVLTHDLVVGHEVVAVVHSRLLATSAAHQVAADLTDPQQVEALWSAERPDLVVHTAALASLERCEQDPGLARTLNAEVPATVARACRTYGARLVHISTDAVFDGSAGPYREQDRTAPLSVYGRTKVDGELACLAELPDALVARVNFFGPSGSSRRSLAGFFLDRLARGQTAPGFTDVEFAPLYSRHLGRLLIEASEAGMTGILHFASRDRVSKHSFGRIVAEVFGYDPGLVLPATVADLGSTAARAPRLSLDPSRLGGELGRELPSVRAGVEAMAADLAAGYEEALVREWGASDQA